MDLACESNFQLLQVLSIIERWVHNIDEPSKDNFKTAFLNLVIIRDTLAGIICPKIKLIVSDNDYKDSFFPLMEQITIKLEIYIDSLHKCIKKAIYKGDPSYKTYLNDSHANTEDLKKQFDELLLMLKPYIKVSEPQH